MSVALVLGGASSLWADVEAALQLGEADGVVTCNDATVYWPGPIAACASYHPEKWRLWLERRRRRGFPPPARIFYPAKQDERDPAGEVTWPRFHGQTSTGSSGLFALKVALLDLRFDRAVLCGVPMDLRQNLFRAEAWKVAESYRAGWLDALPHIAERTRSMSGWTAKLLGRPTEDWMR